MPSMKVRHSARNNVNALEGYGKEEKVYAKMIAEDVGAVKRSKKMFLNV